MKAKDKYIKVFGSINHLSDTVPWTSGIMNLAEHLVWDTKSILGISKKAYWKKTVAWACSDELQGLTLEEKYAAIQKKLDKLLKVSDNPSRYSKTTSVVFTAREALRQMRYFSEDFLNKEFDIFLNLSSDRYLDFLYGRFIVFNSGESWSTHGNGGLFSCSVDIAAMQMDNLAYNDTENILVANELKLGGRKNRDQIIKYCYLYCELEKKGFIGKGAEYLLLFIGDKNETYDLEHELDREISYCKSKGKIEFLSDEILSCAKQLNLKSISWKELIKINEEYLGTLDKTSQVEIKLLQGFNTSLSEKKFMQDDTD